MKQKNSKRWERKALQTLKSCCGRAFPAIYIVAVTSMALFWWSWSGLQCVCSNSVVANIIFLAMLASDLMTESGGGFWTRSVKNTLVWIGVGSRACFDTVGDSNILKDISGKETEVVFNCVMQVCLKMTQGQSNACLAFLVLANREGLK